MNTLILVIAKNDTPLSAKSSTLGKKGKRYPQSGVNINRQISAVAR